MLLQLAALDEGLGTGVYGVAADDVPALKALVRLPADVHFTCVVTVGRSAADPDDGVRSSRLTQARLPVAELVHWERW